jgi:hypothetical protein
MKANMERKKIDEVPPRFELGSLDSKSRVLTITPWDLLFCSFTDQNFNITTFTFK